MKKNKNKIGKILWSFNPFQDGIPSLKSALANLMALSGQAAVPVEPVYVVSPSEVNVVLEFSVPARERYRTVALAQAQKILKALKAENLRPTILIEKSISMTASVKALAKYAESQGASAILASPHAKPGLGQTLLGSFSETLLYQSSTPVILVHPGKKARQPLRRLLFLSDLSPASLEVFDGFARWASALDAEIHLFHSIPRPFSWASFAIDTLLGPDRMSEQQYLLLTRKLREQSIGAFADAAKRQGATFSWSIGIGNKDVTEATLKEIKKRKIDLVGVAGKSGRLKTNLLGSLTRSLLRQAKTPIWIQRSR